MKKSEIKPPNELAQALGAFKGAFRTVGVFSAIINMLMLVPSLYMLQVYDRVITSRSVETLVMLIIIKSDVVCVERINSLASCLARILDLPLVFHC